jgi:hypothetical protein
VYDAGVIVLYKITLRGWVSLTICFSFVFSGQIYWYATDPPHV